MPQDATTGHVDPTDSDVALGPMPPAQRRRRAAAIRVALAEEREDAPAPVHHNNGDDTRYAGQHHYASFSKGLRHDEFAEVDDASYASLIAALSSGRPSDFEEIILGMKPADSAKLTDPQAGLAFDTEGVDSHQLTLRPCYAFASEGAIGEIAENYWLALCRDVAFCDYAHNDLVARAAEDLNRYARFDGPRAASGKVTPATLFRENTAGAKAGPYLSQFMITDVPYGAQRTAAALAFGLQDTSPQLTNEADFIAAQNGRKASAGPVAIPPRLLHDGRGLGNYVHIDELYQAYLNACLLLITPASRGGFGAAVSDDNPYKHSMTQVGFGTLGEPNFKTLVTEVATRALKAVWFQKWYVHRRIRPEVYGARLHWHLKGSRSYDFHPAELAKLVAGPLAEPAILAAQHFLPMQFPEGSPTHPAYGAGHATVAGACVTVLKALFKTDAPLGRKPMQPNADGTALVEYTGPDADALTIGGELDKLAANIGIARNFAGVHWRSDYTESARLGEEVAFHFLRDQVRTYNEDIAFSWTRFDGTRAQVQK